MPSVFVVHGSRGRVAGRARLDVVVDDRPENCLDVVLESKAGAILVWRGSESSVPTSARRMGIGVVATVEAALAALVEAERSGSEGAGLIIASVGSSASRCGPRRTVAADLISALKCATSDEEGIAARDVGCGDDRVRRSSGSQFEVR